ncbi:hypothetical protein NDU88_004740 [Pleurodeles waltl]|uniref:Uncharacterized protein n=1 Tax=Pleurodeles waltl TaxID=8319 RepID=A0AAV7VLL1_PLEWA|nr:hypothetical protein NDU88_004740 [Pleurodeles waltl]
MPGKTRRVCQVKGGELALGSAQEAGLGTAFPIAFKGKGRGKGRGLGRLGRSGCSRQLPKGVRARGEKADDFIDLPGDRDYGNVGEVVDMAPPEGSELNAGGEESSQ